MPKASRVGKFRKAAKASAVASAASAMQVEKEPAKNQPMQEETAPKKTKLEIAASKNPKPKEPKKVADDKKESSSDNNRDDTALSRGQRRRQAKREQYVRKEKMILSTLQLKKEAAQKKRIDGLDALKAALMETVKETKDDNAKSQQTEKQQEAPVTTNKAKKQLVAGEIHRMGLVLQHPAFQENPFQALQEHLKNKLETNAKDNEKQAIQHSVDRQQAKDKRKQDKKERLKEGVKKKNKKGKFKATRRRGKS